MTIPTSSNNYTLGFGTSPSKLIPIVQPRAPASTDITGPNGPLAIGQTWIDTANSSSWTLVGLSSSNGKLQASWAVTGGSSSDLSTLTGDSGGAISPSAGNITLAGTANQIATSGSGSTITYSLVGPYTPATYTAHGVLVGEGTSSIAALSVGTTGQVLIGATGADPAFGALGVNSGLTAHGVLLGEGNSAIAATAVGATGQALMGSTGADPGWTGSPSFSGSVTAGTTITATSGAITATNGNLVMGTAGNKIIVPTGSNASAGTSGVMSGTPGAVTVATTACSATAKVFYCRATAGGTLGNVSITAQDGTGFTLTSTGNETSTFNWWIINA